jgi:8-oxo-dGTP pyrophosphatase MutT (NUDIX family)
MTIQDAVVVILPRVGERVLMQLRDMKEGIAFPGCWGFFGGSIEPKETAIAAAIRELNEELSLESSGLVAIGTERMVEPGGLLCHSFTCELTIPPENIVQNEGMDCALFSLNDVRRGFGYAPRLARNFPMVPCGYLARTVAAMIAVVRNVGTRFG